MDSDSSGRTLEKINQEYSFHAMQHGDLQFKLHILDNQVMHLNGEINNHWKKMKELNEEANQLKQQAPNPQEVSMTEGSAP